MPEKRATIGSGRVAPDSFADSSGRVPVPPAPTPEQEGEVAFAAIDLELDRRIQEANLHANEIAALLLMHLQCDYRTLTWSGSAEKLVHLAKLSYPQARRCLENLERHGFIKRSVVLGRKGNYPITLLGKACRSFVNIPSTMCIQAVDDPAMTKTAESGTSALVTNLVVDEAATICQDASDCSISISTSTCKTERKKEAQPKLLEEPLAFHGKTFALTAEKYERLRNMFPGVNIKPCLLQADSWAIEKAKTIKNPMLFAQNWLRKEWARYQSSEEGIEESYITPYDPAMEERIKEHMKWM